MARRHAAAARSGAHLRGATAEGTSVNNNTIRWFQEKFRDTSHGAVAKLKNAENKLQSDFKRITGENNRPASEWAAIWGRGLRSLETMGKLGNVLSSHLSATSSSARELQRQGERIFESYRNALASWFGGLQGVMPGRRTIC